MKPQIDYENIMDSEFINLSDYERIKVSDCMKEAVRQAIWIILKRAANGAKTELYISNEGPSDQVIVDRESILSLEQEIKDLLKV